jgi:hypothetical protein
VEGLISHAPEVLVYTDLDADTPSLGVVNVFFLVDAPSISAELLSRLNDHVPHQLSLLHQGGTQGLGTCP